MKRSERIKEFLDFIDGCTTEYVHVSEELDKENKRQQDLLHAIEFEPKSKERNKLCTKLHKSRNDRRKYKDNMEELEEIAAFFQDKQHKKTLDQMTQLFGRIRKIEKYHENRTYYPRVRDEV